MKLCILVLAVGAALATAACGSDGDPAAAQADESALKEKKVALRIPLLEETKGGVRLLSVNNDKLEAAGLPKFPDFIEIAGSKSGFATKASHKKWADAGALIDKADAQIHLSLEMVDYGEPRDYETKDKRTSICYVGNPTMVVNLIASLTDSVFSDQLGFHGWRFKHAKHLDESMPPEEEKTFPKIWHDWRGDGDAILLITHTSDDGNEMNVNLIPMCR